MVETILEVKDVGCSKAPGQPIFSHVNFNVNDGDVVVLQGKSGAGFVTLLFIVRIVTEAADTHTRKSTLLKCLAHLNLYEGEILYRGK